MNGHVYVLMNPAFPSLIKIGMTAKTPQERAAELSTTGTPEKYLVVHSIFVNDAFFLEKKLHEFFNDKRYNPNREFFEVKVSECIDAISNIIESHDFLKAVLVAEESDFVNVVLYEIIFSTNYEARRWGVFLEDNANEVGEIDSIDKPKEYLESEGFKQKLIEHYALQFQIYLKNPNHFLRNDIHSFNSLNVQWGFIKGHYKIVRANRFTVGKIFYENLSSVIAEFVREWQSVNPRYNLCTDEQTVEVSWDQKKYWNGLEDAIRDGKCPLQLDRHSDDLGREIWRVKELMIEKKITKEFNDIENGKNKFKDYL
jgi:hypothetical protein